MHVFSHRDCLVAVLRSGETNLIMNESVGSGMALEYRDTLNRRGIKVESKGEAIFACPITVLTVPFVPPVANRRRPAQTIHG